MGLGCFCRGSGQVWTSLDKSEQVWTSLNKSGPLGEVGGLEGGTPLREGVKGPGLNSLGFF